MWPKFHLTEIRNIATQWLFNSFTLSRSRMRSRMRYHCSKCTFSTLSKKILHTIPVQDVQYFIGSTLPLNYFAIHGMNRYFNHHNDVSNWRFWSDLSYGRCRCLKMRRAFCCTNRINADADSHVENSIYKFLASGMRACVQCLGPKVHWFAILK